MKQREFRAEITVFLSLSLVIILSLIGAMMQSATIHINKSMKRADTTLALESVFAEYDQEMMEKYNIFVKLDGKEDVINRRLWFYGAKNMEHKVNRIQLLSDNNGEMLYVQAVRAMGGTVDVIPEITGVSVDEQEKENAEKLDAVLQEEEVQLPQENNPIESVNQLKTASLLSLVLPEPEELSNRYVVLEELPSHRKLNQGNYGGTHNDNAAYKTMFGLYLAQHFPNFTQNSKENSLFYEAEYLLIGKGSDQENLEAVLKKILAIRMASNYAYLLTDETRQAEAETMAIALGSLLATPGAIALIKQAILFAWAYGESILDLRVLLQGEKNPTMKSDATWQLSLENLVKLGTQEEAKEEKLSTEGVCYNDYIKAFLVMEKKEKLCMRALDLIELNVGIRVDGCVTAIEIKTENKMQKNVTDTFLTKYEYQ